MEWMGSDPDKVRLIGNTVGSEIENFTAKRIGKQRDGNTRPIQVTLDDAPNLNDIVEKIKSVSNQSGFNNIRVKKDVHSAVTREWGRLYKSRDDLKANQQNVGHVIEFDEKNRF